MGLYLYCPHMPSWFVYAQLYLYLLPMYTVATADNAMCRYRGTAIAYYSNPHSLSSLLITRIDFDFSITSSLNVNQPSSVTSTSKAVISGRIPGAGPCIIQGQVYCTCDGVGLGRLFCTVTAEPELTADSPSVSDVRGQGEGVVIWSGNMKRV